jgi:hypothetical protein
MAKRTIRSWTVSVLACWLVLMASGDDFNLGRIALFPTDMDAEGLLPLDDPNTDFIPSSEPRDPSATSQKRCSCASSVGKRLTQAVLTSQFAAPAIGHSPRSCINAPLLC